MLSLAPNSHHVKLSTDFASQLYNTMQVREATRGTKMNEIMLLFTIATIVYLPPTFVAVSFPRSYHPYTQMP